ncbi:MAG: NUDIX domain-containing protein [Lachnospiraceae bacterium]|nr:NUDIX domain-containing protein [Lachnospiraceae bacterium]
MKHKRLNRDGWGFQYYPYYQMRIENECFQGLACLIRLTDGEANYWETPKAGRIQVTGAGMTWLELIPDDTDRVLTIIFFPDGTHDTERKNYPVVANEKYQPSIWYVDIIDGVEYDEYGIATFIDKYLDVIFTPEGDVKIDDRDELEAAYASGELSGEQYDAALKECDRILAEYCEDIQKTGEWCAVIRALVEEKIAAGERIKPCREVKDLLENRINEKKDLPENRINEKKDLPENRVNKKKELLDNIVNAEEKVVKTDRSDEQTANTAYNGSELSISLEDNEWPFEYTSHDRRIARAIVFDDEGYFYFVRAERDDDFGKATLIETAGGGAEAGEDLNEAIKRELKEELGAEVEIICKIGTVSDHYNLIHRHNINNYFLCRVVSFGEKHLMPDEIEDFHLSTLKLTFDEALAEYERRRETKLGRLVANREVPVLKRAGELLHTIGKDR